jgi:hypothetical protein
MNAPMPRPRGRAAPKPPHPLDDLEALVAELVRKLGAARARYLAALLDERADEAEEGKT